VGLPDSDAFQWIDSPAIPWPVPVLDVRPLTLGVVSLSKDQQQAANAVSYGADDGAGFIGKAPPDARRISIGLRYRVDPILADGVLFLPSSMEHK
jgi:hypothetical protein